MDLYHIRNDFTACKTIINTVCSLTLSITDICTEVARSFASFILDTTLYLFYQLVNMSASRIAVS